MNSATAQSLLQLMLDDLHAQDAIYQPTAFWSQASSDISHELIEHGFKHFRSLPTVRGFFAPSYGPPYNRLSIEILKKNHGYRGI